MNNTEPYALLIHFLSSTRPVRDVYGFDLAYTWVYSHYTGLNSTGVSDSKIGGIYTNEQLGM